MAAPAAYTEYELTEYLHRVLGQTAGALGLSPEGDTDGRGHYQDAIDETLLAYGVATAALATDVRKLRALARREAWRLALGLAAGEFDFAAGGSSFSRSQLYKHVTAQAALAEAEALAYDDATGALVVVPLDFPVDPYSYRADEERVLA